VPWTYEHLKPKGKPDLLSDEVPWRAMIAPGVVLQKKDGALQRTYQARGPDLAHEPDEVQGSAMLRFNEVFKRLGGEWMFQSEALRCQVTALPPVDWVHPLPALLDARRRADLLVERESRQTTYYMTLTWVPPRPLLKRGLRYFTQGPRAPSIAHATDDLAITTRTFTRQADFLMDGLKGVLAVGRPLTSAETATYLHTCVSDQWYDLHDLDDWNNLDHQLCGSTPLDPAGWYPELGDWHLRTLSIAGYPAESMVGIMQQLDALNMDYRWCIRQLGIEKFIQQQFLKKTEAKWVNQEKSVFDRHMENVTGHQTRVIDPDATIKALDVNAARQEIGMDLTSYGFFTGTFTVWDRDPFRVETKLTAGMQAFTNAGFLVRAEDEHLVAAWLSSHPGNRRDNVRKTPQSWLTVAHLMPGLNASWPGAERDEYLKAGPWFYAQTDGSNIFRVVNHLRDSGHFLLLGDTRSGKSTLANFMRAMWMQYRNAQAKVFDVDGHARLLTYLLDGYWHDLGSPTLRLQPLRRIDERGRFRFLLNWLVDLCEEAGQTNVLLVQKYLSGALAKLAKRPVEERTFSGLLRVFAEPPPGQQSAFQRNRIKVDGGGVAHLDTTLSELDKVQQEVRWVLQKFADGGDYDGVFDGTEDPLVAHPVQTFELRDLVKQSRLIGPVMRYVMFEVREQMATTHPMFLLLDDAAIAWLAPKTDPRRASAIAPGRQTMEEQADDWLQTTAKKSVSLGISTHSVEKILQSRLGQIIIESCKHRYYLPNKGALQKHVRAVYEEMGLTENSIRTVATLMPQRDVFYSHEELGSRPFSLPLTPFELDCLARNAAADHHLMDKILADEGREGFTQAWLRAHGWEEEAHVVEHWGRHQDRESDDERGGGSGAASPEYAALGVR
jgi:type IV secretion system protein TrbE